MAVLRQGRRTPNKKGAGSWIFTICVAICLGVIAWYIMSESLIYTAEGVKISFFNKKKDDTINTTAPTLNITTEAPDRKSVV